MLILAPTLALKAKLFRGFADTSRLSILETLRSGPKSVGEVVAETGLSQPNASAHLACLKECGLLQSEQQGRFVYYSLADAKVVRLLDMAEALLAEVGEQVYRCTRYEK